MAGETAGLPSAIAVGQGDKQRSSIAGNVDFDYVRLNMREGNGTTISDTGELAETAPGTQLITAAKTVSGTVSWGETKGLDHATAQDMLCGFNNDTYPEIQTWLDLTDFRGFFVIACTLELTGDPSATEYLIGVGSYSLNKKGVVCLRLANNGLPFVGVCGTSDAEDVEDPQWIAGSDLTGVTKPVQIMGVVDMRGGWNSETTFTIFTDGVIAGGGWVNVDENADPNDVIRDGAPNGYGLSLFSRNAAQADNTTYIASCTSGGVAFMKDVFICKMTSSRHTKTSINRMAIDWAANLSDLPWEFAP